MIERHLEDAQTLYSELLTMLIEREHSREWSHLSGSFTSKTVKGTEYIYFQISEPGGTKRQLAIGRKTPALEKAIRRYERGRAENEADLEQIGRLASLCRSAGFAPLPHASHRILRAMADAGVFASGGVLVGSYAFQVLGNLLGVDWPDAAWRTQDIDIAGRVRIAVPSLEIDVPFVLDSLQMGFVPVPQLDPKHPSTSYRIRGKVLRVDLITPGGDADEAPVFIPRFNACAAPVKYLSLLMEDVVAAAAIENRTACLVMVPDPARLALHKLLVSQMRAVLHQSKSGKDLHQAALLLEVLAEDRPDDLERAAAAFARSDHTVTKKVARGFQAAVKRWPEAQGAKPHITAIFDS